MAHKKGVGSSKNGRDSNAKRLGVKIHAGQEVSAGTILVGKGGDDTLFALIDGVVAYERFGRTKKKVSVQAH